MAITSVYQLFDGRGGSADANMARTYTRVYEVYVDSPYDDAVTAGTAPGYLPVMGEPHSEDLAAFVTNRDIQQDAADPLRWLVTITYTTQQPGTESVTAPGESLQPNGGGSQAPGDRSENPLARVAAWRVNFQTTQEPATVGFKVANNGDVAVLPTAILNSAGLPFDPPVMVEVSRPVVSVTKNIVNLDLNKLTDLQDSVNSKAWKSFPPRTVRVSGIEVNSAFENGVAFWSITYHFAVNWRTWDVQPLDAGFHERIQTASVPVATYEWREITDDHGAQGPYPLDGNGRVLDPSQDPVYLRWVATKENDFNTMIVL